MKSISQMLAEPRRQIGEETEERDGRPSSAQYLEAVTKGDQYMIRRCKLPEKEQLAEEEDIRFEAFLTREVQRHGDAGIPVERLERGARRAREHRARRRRMAARAERDDPPCKHWRDKIEDPTLLAIAEATWSRSVREWILSTPSLGYLASPAAPCQCRRCDPAGYERRTSERTFSDEFGPLAYPEI